MKKSKKATTDFKWNQIIGVAAFENVIKLEDLPQSGTNAVNFLMLTKGDIAFAKRVFSK